MHEQRIYKWVCNVCQVCSNRLKNSPCSSSEQLLFYLHCSSTHSYLQNFPGLRYRLQRAVAVCVLSLADVLFSLYHHFLLGNRCPRVGWAAHTGGALAGLLLGLLLFREPPPEAVLGRALPPPLPAAPGHKPRREAMLTAVRCGAAATLALTLAAAIALNLMRPGVS